MALIFLGKFETVVEFANLFQDLIGAVALGSQLAGRLSLGMCFAFEIDLVSNLELRCFEDTVVVETLHALSCQLEGSACVLLRFFEDVTNTTPNSMTSEVRAATTKVGVTTSLAGTKWASRE